MKTTTLLIPFIVIAAFAGNQIDYPTSKQIEQVDQLHGQNVADPYRWLEDDVRHSQDVAQWVEAQNQVTFSYLSKLPGRKDIRKRLEDLWDFEKYQTPQRAGNRIFYRKNSGLQNQSVLYMLDALDAEPQVLIDPNQWSQDGTISLAQTVFSPDGRYLAYAVQDGGSDWRIWRIMSVDTKTDLDETLKWSKFSTVSWTADGRGFFYCRYDAPKEGQKFQSLNMNMKVFYHTLGTSQEQDVLVFHREDHPEWGYAPRVSDDGHYLIITVWVGTDDRYRVFYKDLRQAYAQAVPLISDFDYEYSFIGNNGPLFFFKTNRDAPRGKVVSISVTDPNPQAVDIIAHTDDTLRSVDLVGNTFIAQYLNDAKSKVILTTTSGAFIRTLDLPGIGSARGFSGGRTHTDTFYSFSSFSTPALIYHTNLLTGKSSLFRSAKLGIDPDDYVVSQAFYTSKDGTKIPMFITHKKGLKKNGKNPCLLYGYGGFNIALTPGFRPSRLVWMEMGGIFAMANLRGGGEYGKAWHKAGTKLQKQNVFDDFIAAAEFLIDQKYTSSDHLAIQGGSNGGLLVGAAMTQRPDLFSACLPAVGVMDMLRFHKFTAGRFWVDDYGSADNAAEFKALYAYSPYHNLKQGISYPATLITTADTDDRVVPGHSFKFAAALQSAHRGSAPVLIRIETRAGHGAGKPTSKIIEEVADQWAFLAANLGMNLK